ncbi:hypothetical protein LZY01_10670 [Levilactobacillus zymae]|uniref:Serine-type D-Ala-D-Ala carboxypeptidase n=2 Tax=Levilactobacillus zymae TaxID=267363 RepID=A0ABQ0WVL6_9LACO|nr:hypothetical protein [Levilactobacillus zymae]QFR62234.1 hypothetical protein LZ395_12105 [Levilactobacillus zymae]GEO71899.1 hypothetical protein LZY01_10670 [Levilactobacillus zymae]
MQNEVKGLLALGASLGVLGVTTPASASSNYSVARSNSVRLVWRHSMGQYSYTATRGARYSAHLGVRYGANAATPNQVWYTNAHEKLYDRATHRHLIYYHFKAQAPYDATAIDRALSKVGYDAKTRASYRGWAVGGGVLALSNDQADAGEYPGEGLVLLVRE